MRKVESLSLKYVGYKEPQNETEVEFEILGLETIMAAAKQRIAVLKQSLRLIDIMKNATGDESNAQTVQEASDIPKA
jgi:hypothetical protein